MRTRLALAAALVASPSPALACVAIGAGGPVAIRGEEALIVWDPATKTEHFVRRAFFKNPPADFGFLVPTPGQPTLTEVPQLVFERLFALYKQPTPPTNSRARSTDALGAAAAVAPPVQVISQQVVAGLDATVLLASDPKALSTWLGAHHYPSSPAIERWLAPYVKKGAYVTAFKLAGGAQASAKSSVRMSFTTDAPFFPYSEPADPQTPRPFRLSVIAPTRMEGTMADQIWRARVGYAAPIKEDEARALLDEITPRAAQKNSFVTVFDEPSSKRGAADLILRPAKDSARVAPSIATKIEP